MKPTSRSRGGGDSGSDLEKMGIFNGLFSMVNANYNQLFITWSRPVRTTLKGCMDFFSSSV